MRFHSAAEPQLNQTIAQSLLYFFREKSTKPFQYSKECIMELHLPLNWQALRLSLQQKSSHGHACSAHLALTAYDTKWRVDRLLCIQSIALIPVTALCSVRV